MGDKNKGKNSLGGGGRTQLVTFRGGRIMVTLEAGEEQKPNGFTGGERNTPTKKKAGQGTGK